MTVVQFILKLALVFQASASVTSFGAFQSTTLGGVRNKNGCFAFKSFFEQDVTAQDDKPLGSGSSPLNRRDVLVGPLLVAVTAATASWQQQHQQQQQEAPLVTIATGGVRSLNGQPLSSLKEAMSVIDAQCDRRFLHAVVSSDYHLLYRGVAAKRDAKRPSIYTMETPPETDRVPVASEFQRSFSLQLGDSPLNSWNSGSPFHLCATNAQSLTRTQVVSVWPLGDNVHFAWPETEQSTFSDKLIVDGVNCGVMSLEDALERENGQVMVHSSSFLMVPATMTEELIDSLKGSFII